MTDKQQVNDLADLIMENAPCTIYEEDAHNLAERLYNDGWRKQVAFWFGDMMFRVVTRRRKAVPKIAIHKRGSKPEVERGFEQEKYVRKIKVTKRNFLDLYDKFGKSVFKTKEDAEHTLACTEEKK
jgi:hypothetical protein